MSRLNRSLLAVALFAFASFARAESLRLVTPAAGATLHGGSFAELRWSAEQLPASAEEWEAFLSVDGGKYYAFRITPHLDIDRRRFTFLVPNVDSREARILIRTGDEVHEAHFETNDSFAITCDPNAEQLVPPLVQFGRGEAARDGDPAVLAWTEGARNGSGVTRQASTPIPSHSFGRIAEVTTDAPPVLAPAGKWAASPASTSTQRTASYRDAPKSAPLPRSVDLLQVCSRWNI